MPIIKQKSCQYTDGKCVAVIQTTLKILDCNMDGMTIDGVLVADMISAYKKQQK